MVLGKLYGVLNETTGELIWSARGSAYKERGKAERKLQRLKKQHPENSYLLVVYEPTYTVKMIELTRVVK